MLTSKSLDIVGGVLAGSGGSIVVEKSAVASLFAQISNKIEIAQIISILRILTVPNVVNSATNVGCNDYGEPPSLFATSNIHYY